MNLQIELKNGVMTAVLGGELDHHTVGRLREEIDSTAMKVKPKLLRLDFSDVPFMDSSGIGLILGRVRVMAVWGGQVALIGLSPQLKRMAELSGVAALASFEKKAKGA
ncbi:MAG: anti-sigma factor antagonist [Clostridia bacterium]|nr:anti-sigma factor antagonist [Clostridia bacterium]